MWTKKDWPFDDGSAPPANIVKGWLDLIDKVFPDPGKKKSAAAITAPTTPQSPNNSAAQMDELPTIAIHCVAGLGRAPLLVAIALMEKAGMGAHEAIGYIRKRRKGAINAKQLQFIEKYKPVRNGNCKVMWLVHDQEDHFQIKKFSQTCIVHVFIIVILT